MKTLYVTDLDGTLLTSRKCISEYSIQTINQLVEKGMLFTYATARSLSSASKVTEGLHLKTPIVAYNGANLYEGDVFYFTCIGEKDQFERAYDVFSQDERYTCTLQPEPHRQEEYWLEIMPRKATKANAILKLKEILGCDKVISFGDAMNDIPMFQISDECYAMENAVEELKKIATGIIDSNDADGVAIWLKENV